MIATLPRIVLDALYEATRDFYPRLHALIPETTSQVSESQIGKSCGVTKFVIPWNTPAADLYFDIHAAARRYEAALALKLWGKVTFRPGTDAVTREVLDRLPVLVGHAIAAGHDDTGVIDPANDLGTWPARIRAMLDEARPDEQPWTKAPGGLTRPHCERRLELAPGWRDRPEATDVVCRSCRDDEGRWYRWALATWTAVLRHHDAS